jgi:pterin-4a-carbinolamine dehydratase
MSPLCWLSRRIYPFFLCIVLNPPSINNKLVKTFRFNNYDDIVLFANKVMEVAILQNHHPEINIHYSFVKVSITDYENGAVSEKCHGFTIAVDQI